MARKAKLFGILLAFCMMAAVCVPFVSAVEERQSEPGTASTDIQANEPKVGGWFGGDEPKNKEYVINLKLENGTKVRVGTADDVSEVEWEWDKKDPKKIAEIRAKDRKTGEWHKVPF